MVGVFSFLMLLLVGERCRVRVRIITCLDDGTFRATDAFALDGRKQLERHGGKFVELFFFLIDLHDVLIGVIGGKSHL